MLVHFFNTIANILGPGRYSSKMRILLLNIIGNKISLMSRFAGGGYVYGNRLTVGSRSFVGRSVYFDLTQSVWIGDDVVIGHGVTFITANHEIGDENRRCGKVVAGRIVVGRGAWIAANVTIMPGVTIGEGAVVGANALVLRDVANNTLALGVPARYIRDLKHGHRPSPGVSHRNELGG
jgi:maltose O-acetyltransferase